MNRRDFLSAAAIATSMFAVGFNMDLGQALAKPAAKGRRVGISDEAYAAARSRATAITAQLTVPEKIAQLNDKSPAISRLNLPAYNYYTSEALHGLMINGQVTSFPVPLALAASWNPELFLKVYEAVADECRAHDSADHSGLSFYSPVTLNLHRDPRWGRCYEAPGEDPCLAATVAVQVVRGMQGDDPNFLKTTACSKHFICNNTDNDREATSASVDSRSFWEFYTRAYRETILHGDVFTFMSAYNAVNGVPCSADYTLLTELLRHQWGFRGYVTSDCDAVKDIFNPHHYAPDAPTGAAMAIKAGCDLDCWGEGYSKNLQAAYDRGLVTESDISDAVTNVLTVRVLLGTLDSKEKDPYSSITMTSVPWKDHADLAIESARQSIVLLKNEKSFLPLNPAKIKNVAVIGPLGDICHLGGYSGGPTIQISPLQGLSERLGFKIALDYIPAGNAAETHGSASKRVSFTGAEAITFTKTGDWASFKNIDFTGKTELRINGLSMTSGDLEIRLDSANGALAGTIHVKSAGFRMSSNEYKTPISNITGAHDMYIVYKEVADDEDDTDFGEGMFGGGPRRNFVNVERLTFYPLPDVTTASKNQQILFQPGCGVTGGRDEEKFQRAVAVAKNADLVVLTCGVDSSVSREGMDRQTIGLTGAQPELIKAVYAANPNAVLVLSTNNSVSIEWEQANIPAILAAICAGQAQGTAIAEVLFGDYNPGGKVTTTWYRSLDELPPSHDYDIHKGRTYQYFKGDPLYPFGFGLSYTTFHTDRFEARAKKLGQDGTAKYSVRVSNTGNRKGAEVIQLYVVPPESSVKRPQRQLAGFQRVELKPGETKTVVFELAYSALPFWYWSDAERRFVCQPGTATIEIGNSTANLPFKASLEVLPATKPLPQKDAVDTVAINSYIV